MGNCQAADAATVVIQHPDGKLEKAYWSLPATQVMAANPGHYVAVIITVPHAPSTSDHGGGATGDRKPARYLKLLRPDDTLLIGHVYRLVSFEEVLRQFASKRNGRLSRLLVKQEEIKSSSKRVSGDSATASVAGVKRDDRGGQVEGPENSPAPSEEKEVEEAQLDTELEQVVQGMTTNARPRAAGAVRHGQWRPALQSIAEVGTS
ncbi:hypothetical protein Cni_G01058 [Canna indica]|uniref:DUF4228 domain-containing protein n=1 Tax=Canna indica TaxID=4628 RepID=A0AAQ3JML4_9LILI|nr:hypothetical protein Cni_G01058 [Canna indica]